jgi:hypothetical protein
MRWNAWTWTSRGPNWKTSPLPAAVWVARLHGRLPILGIIVQMNIFEALRVSHETQREISARLLAHPEDTPERQQIFIELKRELLAHETAEERCFYVPLIEHDATVDLSRHAIAEHHEMDEMVEHLEELAPASPEWLDCAKKLCEKVEHHLIEEEHKFFQEAGKVLSEGQKQSLAKEYEAEFLTLRVKEG